VAEEVLCTPETWDKLNKVACSAHQNELAVQQQAANQKSSDAELTKNYAFRARRRMQITRSSPTIFPRFFTIHQALVGRGNQLSMCNRIKRGMARERVNEFTRNENLNAATALAERDAGNAY
jgi:hypothetical protein